MSDKASYYHVVNTAKTLGMNSSLDFTYKDFKSLTSRLAELLDGGSSIMYIGMNKDTKGILWEDSEASDFLKISFVHEGGYTTQENEFILGHPVFEYNQEELPFGIMRIRHKGSN